MSLGEGKFLVGKFSGVKQVTRKDESVVERLFEIVLVRTGAEEDEIMRASFFETDYDSGTSRVAQQLTALTSSGLVPGDVLIVKVAIRATPTTDGKRAFINYNALSVERNGAVAPKVVR